MKTVTGQVADATGHTDFTGSIADAIKLISEKIKNSQMWAVVNGEPFFSKGSDELDGEYLTNAFEQAENPAFAIVGELVGGLK